MSEDRVKLQLQLDRYKRFLAYGYDPLTRQRWEEAVQELEKRIAELPHAAMSRDFQRYIREK